MKPSLFDQLYNKLDVESLIPGQNPITPAQRTPESQEALTQAPGAAPKNFTGMKFTHSLIKHLDMLYGKMLAGEVAEMTSDPSNNPKQKVIEGATDSIILNEKESYYSPGNSNVTESF